MDNYNFLANYVPRPQQQQSIVDSLGTGFQLGRKLGAVPLENALQTAKMEEIENFKKARDAYAETGDINALAIYDPKGTAQLSLEQQKQNTAETIPMLKTLYALSPGLVKPETFDQTRGQLVNLFPRLDGSIPPTWTPETPALVADGLKGIGALISKAEGKEFTVVPQGAIAIDRSGRTRVANPLQARPIDSEVLNLRQQRLDQGFGRGGSTRLTGPELQQQQWQDFKKVYPDATWMDFLAAVARAKRPDYKITTENPRGRKTTKTKENLGSQPGAGDTSPNLTPPAGTEVFDELPDPSKYKGRTLNNGQLISDGTKWVPNTQ